MLEIISIEPGSIADELDLVPGDRLLRVNGEAVADLVDFLLAETETTLQLEIEHADGEVWLLEIEHDNDEPLGLGLPHPEPKQCGNNCIFCFVHQLPRGMRRTLYVKDEDYRFSYLYGAYVTLTNLADSDLQRILTKKLSPLYVSVHATDHELREQLLGNPARELMPILQVLVEGGIELHTQVVVCPQINDGPHLEQTLRDLVVLAPGIKSLAIVPVGLTGHRSRLYALRTHSADEAAALIDWVEARQAELLEQLGTRFVFAADELYLKAGRPFPGLDQYEDLAQIENGIGLIPSFRSQAKEVLDSAEPLDLPPVHLVTGASAFAELKSFASSLAERSGVDLSVHMVENRFFGAEVTVAGLLTGQDLIAYFSNLSCTGVLLLPDVMLREGEQVFLDDVTVEQLSDRLGLQVEIVIAEPWGVWDMLDTLAMEPGRSM